MKKAALFILFACIFTSQNKAIGKAVNNNPPITKEITLPDFTGIVTQGAFDLEITSGETQSVKAIGDEDDINATDFEVVNGICLLKLKKGTHRNLHLLIKITSPNLESIALSGAGDVLIKSLHSNSGILHLSLQGAGDIDVKSLHQNIRQISCQIKGAGDINLDINNKPESLDIDIEGSGDLMCAKMDTQNCSISIKGSGDVTIGKTEELEVQILGSGDVHFSGNPHFKSKQILGSGSLIRD